MCPYENSCGLTCSMICWALHRPALWWVSCPGSTQYSTDSTRQSPLASFDNLPLPQLPITVTSFAACVIVKKEVSAECATRAECQNSQSTAKC